MKSGSVMMMCLWVSRLVENGGDDVFALLRLGLISTHYSSSSSGVPTIAWFRNNSIQLTFPQLFIPSIHTKLFEEFRRNAKSV